MRGTVPWEAGDQAEPSLQLTLGGLWVRAVVPGLLQVLSHPVACKTGLPRQPGPASTTRNASRLRLLEHLYLTIASEMRLGHHFRRPDRHQRKPLGAAPSAASRAPSLPLSSRFYGLCLHGGIFPLAGLSQQAGAIVPPLTHPMPERCL